VLDLYGYRRHGHNEGDEPGFTQPLMYEKIKNQPSVMTLYTNYLLKKKVFTESEIQKLKDEINNKLSAAFDSIKKKSSQSDIDSPVTVQKEETDSVKPAGETAVSSELLNKVIDRITAVPDKFNIHPKLRKLLEGRRQFLNENVKADWAMAEALAFGTLLAEGTPVRLSGQDSVRGTFSQRHLSLTDMQTGAEYYPLNNISEEQAKLEALDSLLSEAAVLGFEYGYSTADPLALVLWEAQFGDFGNGAQVIIDNFITVSYEKWDLRNSLVMLLPHGYETQGPEHSSARLERYLTLCAQDNMQVCNPTTPAQYFHVLRRQIKSGARKPLVIMTPKSMLRLPEARSPREEFISAKFLEVIDDNIVDKQAVNRVLLTSGKVYYDLLKFRTDNKSDNTAIVRVEQFYPYSSEKIKDILASYSNAKKVVWVQEEPKNMGAWMFLSSRLTEDLAEGQKLYYSGRPESASPAAGSARVSAQQQKDLVEVSFKL
jgi:2-oxoglutarate dehydrogenase E1 component